MSNYKQFKFLAIITTLAIAPTLQQHPAAQAESNFNCTVIQDHLDLTEAELEVSICEYSDVEVRFLDGSIISMPLPGNQTIFTKIDSDGTEQIYSVSLSDDLSLTASSRENKPNYDLASTPLNSVAALINDGGGSAGVSDIGCAYSTYNLSGLKWEGDFNWYYDYRGESSSRALSRILEGMGYWQNPLNRCTGESFSTNFKANFLGNKTTLLPRTTTKGCAGPFDGKNLVSWKTLNDDSTLGFTCVNINTSITRYTEADIVLNTSFRDFFYDYQNPDECPALEYYLVNTAAHEFGHVLGLNHVPWSMHQIMSEFTGYCVREKTGLAPGDYNGLMQIYGLDTSNVAI